ncbi:hypothetical protein JOQ06_029827 [Pogonophryne albipinna]|uniref:Uncharacterized protein n=1 Tax=Pogonophryne albipinna TaxID=1090488 RepID=A0AAD6AVW0_9TELE|nr:hypothetical protein JOQ06_029827 [Pogonophryne albipinna]
MLILSYCSLYVSSIKTIFSLKMPTVSAASLEAPAVTVAPEQKKPLKACCACPETKQVRDAWAHINAHPPVSLLFQLLARHCRPVAEKNSQSEGDVGKTREGKTEERKG